MDYEQVVSSEMWCDEQQFNFKKGVIIIVLLQEKRPRTEPCCTPTIIPRSVDLGPLEQITCSTVSDNMHGTGSEQEQPN